TAFKSHEVDFGYELVDQDWVLDFSSDAYAKTAQMKSTNPGSASPMFPNTGGGMAKEGARPGNGGPTPLPPPPGGHGGGGPGGGGTGGGPIGIGLSSPLMPPVVGSPYGGGIDGGSPGRPSFVPIRNGAPPIAGGVGGSSGSGGPSGSGNGPGSALNPN